MTLLHSAQKSKHMNTHDNHYTRFQTFAVFWMFYAFFWVIPRQLNFICRRFGILCSIFIGGYEDGTAECSETSAYKIQTPRNYPEESIQRYFTHYFHQHNMIIKEKNRKKKSLFWTNSRYIVPHCQGIILPPSTPLPYTPSPMPYLSSDQHNTPTTHVTCPVESTSSTTISPFTTLHYSIINDALAYSYTCSVLLLQN